MLFRNIYYIYIKMDVNAIILYNGTWVFHCFTIKSSVLVCAVSGQTGQTPCQNGLNGCVLQRIITIFSATLVPRSMVQYFYTLLFTIELVFRMAAANGVIGFLWTDDWHWNLLAAWFCSSRSICEARCGVRLYLEKSFGPKAQTHPKT